ncbi:exopolysaccharide biosynthesis protein [Chachezhania antarctica]|uniref:exopolysaccharide biosynthesis protein n=1 Tax=Chachezhania antarctica TaxID=2340860 RepID=UPI000EB08E9A|nr:exopolysaccharide biosynthesis protein [Chachezhania antarctica]
MADTDNQVNKIFDDLGDAASARGEVRVGTIAENLGHRGIGPFLTVPALIEISPIGGIPGMPTLLAAIIVLFAAQIAIGRKHIWLPDVLERQTIPGDKLRKTTDKMRPVADWLDKWFHERLPRFASHGAKRIGAVIVILLCTTVPPLELIPFASTAPMAAIALIGLALTVRDGALMLAAYALAAIGLIVSLASWLGG